FRPWVLLRPPPPQVRAIGDKAPGAEARPGAQVLVVDDERLVRDVASIALRRAGYAVRDVGSGEEALRLFEEAPRAYDAVVLELTLPGIQGRGVLEAMRARRADIPILLTSGYTSHEAGDLTTAPATTFLQKPWRPDQLVATLEGLTGRAVRRDAGDTQPEAQAVARTGMLGSNGGRSS
ncbi:MAG: response regulator, partial [Luteitalea sp.]